MVTRYIKAYPRFQSLVMRCNTINKNENEVTERYGDGLSIFAEFERLKCNLSFSQTSQDFLFASFVSIK